MNRYLPGLRSICSCSHADPPARCALPLSGSPLRYCEVVGRATGSTRRHAFREMPRSIGSSRSRRTEEIEGPSFTSPARSSRIPSTRSSSLPLRSQPRCEPSLGVSTTSAATRWWRSPAPSSLSRRYRPGARRNEALVPLVGPGSRAGPPVEVRRWRRGAECSGLCREKGPGRRCLFSRVLPNS